MDAVFFVIKQSNVSVEIWFIRMSLPLRLHYITYHITCKEKNVAKK